MKRWNYFNLDIKNEECLHTYFKTKRIIQTFWAVEATLILICLQRIFLEDWVSAIVTFLTSVILIKGYFLAKQNKITPAATFLLSIPTIMITYFIWVHGGIYDEALLAYPIVLIVASMIGDRLLFSSLLIFMTLSVSLNGLANENGWVHNAIMDVNTNRAFLVLLIFWLLSYTIWVISSDFYLLIQKLSNENKKVVMSKKNIEKLLNHDTLTGLPNRAKAEEIFTEAFTKLMHENEKLCVMFIDIDDFKLVNDALGHQAGDELLKKFAERLQSAVRKSDKVCRFAGDEFVIILESIDTHDNVRRIAENILKVVKAPYCYQNNELICSCSIGISLSPNHGNDFETLVKRADIAMYYSKSIGGKSFHFYDTSMNEYGYDYLTTVADLRKAIKDQQFILHYQPKINLKTNQIIGAEALIRWLHPEKGLIFPDAFITQAEKSGLIVDIGAWVMEEACKVCQSWIDQGFINFNISVNVSTQQFRRGNCLPIVHSALNNSGLDAKHLDIEMTESLLVDNSNELKQTIQNLSALGITFSIDDFGTGYSNLSYLKEFEIDTLKIDRRFIGEIEHSPKDKALVTAIIQMAKSLSLHTVAEGIESNETANLLIELECDNAQGYFWSKGLAADEFIEFVQAHSVKG